MATSNELFELGKAATMRGDRQQAHTYLQQALEVDQENEQALVWLAGVVDEPGRQQTYLSRALQINPDSVQAQKGLAWLKERNPDLFQPAAETISLQGSAFAPPAELSSPLADPQPLSPFSSTPAGEQTATSGSGAPSTHQDGAPAQTDGQLAQSFGPPSDQYPGAPAQTYGQPPLTYSALPGQMAPAHSGMPQSYYVPQSTVVGRGKNVGCVSAFMLVNSIFMVIGVGAGIWLLRLILSPSSGLNASEQRDFQQFNEVLARDFISLQALMAILVGVCMFYVIGTVGVMRRAIWGWYIAITVLGLGALLGVLQVIASIAMVADTGAEAVGAIVGSLPGLLIYGFLISVLWKSRKVFR